MATPPIACSLNASDREQRGVLIAQLASDALIAQERDGRSLGLRFHPGQGVEERVRQWATLEAECCPFLTMTVGASDSAVTVRIDGPPDAEPIIDAFAARVAS
jgi:hypothetical protein